MWKLSPNLVSEIMTSCHCTSTFYMNLAFLLKTEILYRNNNDCFAKNLIVLLNQYAWRLLQSNQNKSFLWNIHWILNFCCLTRHSCEENVRKYVSAALSYRHLFCNDNVKVVKNILMLWFILHCMVNNTMTFIPNISCIL